MIKVKSTNSSPVANQTVDNNKLFVVVVERLKPQREFERFMKNFPMFTVHRIYLSIVGSGGKQQQAKTCSTYKIVSTSFLSIRQAHFPTNE